MLDTIIGVITVAIGSYFLYLILRTISRTLYNKRCKEESKKRFAEREQWLRAQEEAAKAEQQALVIRYYNSPLFKEIIDTVCRDNRSADLPSQIIIEDNGVKGVFAGSVREYDFISHRVPLLEHASCMIDRCGAASPYVASEECIVRPQLAMAEAINCILGDEYTIEDRPKRLLLESGKLSYDASQVVMQLKATKSF